MGVRGHSGAQRWEAASRMAAGQDDGSNAGRRKRLIIVAVVCVTVLAVIGALVGALLAGHHSHQAPRHHAVPLWREIAGSVLMLGGAVLAVRGLRVMWKSGNGLFPYFSSPLFALTGAERRRVNKQVRGKAAADTDHLPVLREVAVRISRQRRIATMYDGIVLFAAGQALASSSWLRVGIAVLYLALMTFSAVWIRYDAKRAEDFLRRHPA